MADDFQLEQISAGLGQLHAVHFAKLTGDRNATNQWDGVFRGVCSGLEKLGFDEPMAQLLGHALNTIAAKAAKQKRSYQAGLYEQDAQRRAGSGGRTL